MITDELIKSEFIHQVVSRDMKLIYNTQEEVVTNYLNVGTGRLKNFLSRKPFELYSENQFKRFITCGFLTT